MRTFSQFSASSSEYWRVLSPVLRAASRQLRSPEHQKPVWSLISWFCPLQSRCLIVHFLFSMVLSFFGWWSPNLLMLQSMENMKSTTHPKILISSCHFPWISIDFKAFVARWAPKFRWSHRPRKAGAPKGGSGADPGGAIPGRAEICGVDSSEFAFGTEEGQQKTSTGADDLSWLVVWKFGTWISLFHILGIIIRTD